MHAFNNTTTTPTEKIHKGLAMINREPELASYPPIAYLGTTKADSMVPTAYTDGRNVGIAPAFIDWLTQEELNFVLMHEYDHIALLDLVLMADCFKRDAQLANAACDYANNLILADLAAKYPHVLAVPVHKDGPMKGKPYCLLDEKYRGMSKRAIFESLLQQVEEEQQDSDDSDDGDEQGDQQQCSNPGQWGKTGAVGEESEEGEEDQQDTGGDNGGEAGEPSKGSATDNKSAGKESQPMTATRKHIEDNQWDKHDFDRVSEMPADAQQEMVADVREAVAQGQVLATVAGSKSNRSHEGALIPEVLWHEIFREFVKTNVTKGEDLTTWRRYKGSLVGQGVYMPTYYSERMTRLVVARDTSGSIGDAVINLFNGYLVSIADEVRPEEIIVLDWGSGVVNDERYTELEGYDSIMTRTRVMGGGGTSPECIGSYLKHHNIEADAIVVLTDGCFDRYDFDDYGSPTLWCVLPEYWDMFKPAMPKFGQAVKINGF